MGKGTDICKEVLSNLTKVQCLGEIVVFFTEYRKKNLNSKKLSNIRKAKNRIQLRYCPLLSRQNQPSCLLMQLLTPDMMIFTWHTVLFISSLREKMLKVSFLIFNLTLLTFIIHLFTIKKTQEYCPWLSHWTFA